MQHLRNQSTCTKPYSSFWDTPEPSVLEVVEISRETHYCLRRQWGVCKARSWLCRMEPRDPRRKPTSVSDGDRYSRATTNHHRVSRQCEMGVSQSSYQGYVAVHIGRLSLVWKCHQSATESTSRCGNKGYSKGLPRFKLPIGCVLTSYRLWRQPSTTFLAT